MDDDGIENYKIIIVNDGSRDRTKEVIINSPKSKYIELIEHPINKGLGESIRDGLRVAVEQSLDRDIIITMDADDTHTPGLIPRLIRSIREGYDVVIASRYRKGSRVLGLSWSRRAFSYLASVTFRILFPMKGVKDFTCGYRAYRSSVLRNAFQEYGDDFIDQKGFQCMVDILLKLRKRELIFGEVPFILRYDYKEGFSKMDVKKTISDTILLILKRKVKGVS